jgi:ATP-dependent Lon protease
VNASWNISKGPCTGILHVESSTYPGSGRLHLTGNLGDVIRESANLALAWVRANAWSLGLTDSRVTDVLAKRDIHIHLPAGGIPKDGPSAGVAMVMSVVSLLSGKALDVRLACVLTARTRRAFPDGPTA